MLNNSKNIFLAMVLWLVSKPGRTAVIILVFGFLTVLALSVVLMPETAAIAASASSGSP